MLKMYGDSVADDIWEVLSDQEASTPTGVFKSGLTMEQFEDECLKPALNRWHRAGAVADTQQHAVIHIGANNGHATANAIVLKRIIDDVATMHALRPIVVLLPAADPSHSDRVNKKIESVVTDLVKDKQGFGDHVKVVSIARDILNEPSDWCVSTPGKYTDYHPTEACIQEDIVPYLHSLFSDAAVGPTPPPGIPPFARYVHTAPMDMELVDYNGTTCIGTDITRSLKATCPTMAKAFREIVDNSCSRVDCRTCDIYVTTALRVGSHTQNDISVLVVKTDTYFNVKDLHVGHSQGNEHGALNTFGVGLKAFQARLGTHMQMLLVTYRKHDNGVEQVAMARTGSVMNKLSGGDEHLGICYAGGRYVGDVPMLKWGQREAQDTFCSNSPWYNWMQSNDVITMNMARVLEDVRANGEERATFFMFYNDQTNDFPLRMGIPDALTDPNTGPTGPTLCVDDEDNGKSVSLVAELSKMYIDVKDVSTSTMPKVRIGNGTIMHELNVKNHPWNLAADEHTASSTYDVYGPDIGKKLASVKYVRNVDNPNANNAYMTAHTANKDGAFFVVDTRKVIAEPTAFFDGSVFGVDNAFEKYLNCARSHGNGVRNAQCAALRNYVCCGITDVEAVFDDLVNKCSVFDCEGRQELWPRVGLGTLALIDINTDAINLDMTKTHFLFHDTGTTGAQCLARLRFHHFAWSVCDAMNIPFAPPFSTPTRTVAPRVRPLPVVTPVPGAATASAAENGAALDDDAVPLRLGTTVEVYTRGRNGRLAYVVDFRQSPEGRQQVLVHCFGNPAYADEWVNVESVRSNSQRRMSALTTTNVGDAAQDPVATRPAPAPVTRRVVQRISWKKRSRELQEELNAANAKIEKVRKIVKSKRNADDKVTALKKAIQ